MMQFLRRSLTGLLLMALTLGALAWAGQAVLGALRATMAEDTPDRPAQEIVMAVNLVAVEPGRAIPVIDAFGEVAAQRSLDLRAAAAGRIVEMAEDFRTGGRVAAGTILWRIDPAEAEAALAVARADLAEAEAALRDAEISAGIAADDLSVAREQADLRAQALDRQRDLAERGVGSAAAVEEAALAAAQARQQVVSRRQALAQAEAAVAQAETRLQRARIAVAEAERTLDDTVLRAPFDGALAGIDLRPGTLVARNEALGRLVDLSALEVAVRLSTAQYARLIGEDGSLPSTDVTAILEVGDVALTAPGRLVRDSAEVGAGGTGRLVFAELDGAGGFRPGDIVTVRIAEPPLDGVARLPALAVDPAGTVLVPGDDMRLTEAPVEIVRRQGDTVLVRADALAGAEIVAERTPQLGAGIKVRRLDRPQADAPAPQTASARPGADMLLDLTPQHRARLTAFVESEAAGFSDPARERLLGVLAEDRVPADVVRRIETRMGS